MSEKWGLRWNKEKQMTEDQHSAGGVFFRVVNVERSFSFDQGESRDEDQNVGPRRLRRGLASTPRLSMRSVVL